MRYDPKYERPSEVDALIGDASKAEELLGWKPTVPLLEGLERLHGWYQAELFGSATRA